MRDTIKSKQEYFTKFIRLQEKLINESQDRIKNGETLNKNISFVLHRIFLKSLEILIAKYSRGDAIEDMYSSYSYCIENLKNDWEDSEVKFKKGPQQIVYDKYWLNDYCYMIWMLSFAYLLKVPQEEVNVLKDKIMGGNIKDELILFLLNALTPIDLQDIKREETTYNPFKHLTNGGIEETDSHRLKRYMGSWYKRTKLLTWHNYGNHGRPDSLYYYGRWSFEAAAVTAILNIDDTIYRDHQYYPKDLVDYYRKQE